jgi:UDP-GlcNAc3NAcA epimerase
MKLKVVTIVGARPQFVKAAMVSRALRKHRGCREILIHTGQHYDANMSARFFEELEIPEPDHNLGVGSGSHGDQTGRMLTLIEKILLQEKPDWTLVYGDTNSTLAGALAAAKLHIPVAHVEAGLRSFNRRMPEEINRVLTDHVSEMLFAPTKTAVVNLAAEGIGGKNVALVGDVMCDAAIFYARRAAQTSPILKHLKLESNHYILATIHRAENTDALARLKIILRGLELVAKKIPVVLPLHPRTRAVMKSVGLTAADVRIIEPVGYLEMIELERHAAVIATDSGGVQKEAYFHRVPCVTLRAETEWTELVRTGWNRLCPPKSTSLLAKTILAAIGKPGKNIQLYGGGNAAGCIVEKLTAGRGN